MMMLGSDVSALSTTAATAAAQGLSIVVPLYNEAAGLAFLHQRLGDLAKALRQRYGVACEVVYVDDGGTGPCPARRDPVHGRRWSASARHRRETCRPLDRWRL